MPSCLGRVSGHGSWPTHLTTGFSFFPWVRLDVLTSLLNTFILWLQTIHLSLSILTNCQGDPYQAPQNLPEREGLIQCFPELFLSFHPTTS